jgi:hypothetical protein
MHPNKSIFGIAIALILSSKSLAADVVNSKTLRIIDEAEITHSVSANEISKLPRQIVKVKDHGHDAEFEGVIFVDLLKSVGVEFGERLKGPRAANVIVLEAKDGYRVSITLAEIDPETTDRLVLLADRRDGQPLSDKEGPFRLVIPDDKRPLRWIRMIRTIRVLNLKNVPLVDSAQSSQAN